MGNPIVAQVKGHIGRGVRSAFINEDGHLILIMTDKAEIDLGSVIGPEGAGIESAAINEDGHLILNLTDGKKVDAGTVGAPVDATLSKSGLAADAAETGKIKTIAMNADQRACDAERLAEEAAEKATAAQSAAAAAGQKALSAEQKAENAGQAAADAERTAGEAKTRADEAFELASQGGGGSGGGIHVGDDPPEDPNVAGWLRIREPSEVLVKAPIPANVGQMLRVVAVDEKGVPTQWEVVTPPQALPNPHALTFTGAVVGSYNGIEPLNIEIPAVGGSGGGVTRRITSLKTTEEATQYEFPLENMEDSELFFYVGDSGAENKFKYYLIFPKIGEGNIANYTKYDYTASGLSSQYHYGKGCLRLMSLVDHPYKRQVGGLAGPYYNGTGDDTPRIIIQSQSESNPFPAGTNIHIVEIYHKSEVAE